MIARLGANTASDGPDAALDALTGWEREVLHRWAPDLVPEATSIRVAMRRLAQQAADPDHIHHLHERLSAAVQARSRSARPFGEAGGALFG